ncbi:MAG: glycoside hydrolase family 2 protein [Clostridia bacterium]|nr:glycoside hydrolase family 2 protein [Clostridia bacterium]
MKFSLRGSWTLKNITDNDIAIEANLPSTNYNDLFKAGIIPNPFEKTNEEKTKWVANKDWQYEREFELSEGIINSERIDLCADMLDTVAEVYVNDQLVSKTNNAHIAYRFDIKPYVNVGRNTIKIILYSPIAYASSEAQRIGQNYMIKGFDKRIFVRKNQSHYGWDWGPEIACSGILKDIYIDYGNNIVIDDLLINQKHIDGKVELDVNCVLKGNVSSLGGEYYTINVKEPNGNVITKQGVLNNTFNRTIIIEHPLLWWTHELNPIDEQYLYEVEVLIGENGKYESQSKFVGLRTIELDRSKDKYGSNFCFKLNGVPIFAKGANWIPADSFPDRIDYDVYEYYVKSAVEANMNMIRVWGGGYYEDDEFYSLCDRYGVLIWQDFCFACRPYPFFDECFLANVKEEIAYNVKRLRHHPALALWCGNNEVEQMSNTWFWHKSFVDHNKKFFWETLPSELRKYDSVTPFVEGSPVGVEFNKGVSCDNHGDNHLWNVWHGLQDVKYYRKRDTRFCSEFGFESLPDLKTIEKYADREDYNITSEVFLAHQKCMLGNQKMQYYITSRFRLPKNFEDYVYLSQACQMECIKDATEYWRRNRERSNGSLYWQLNDCWPVCSWSSIDYYGNYKALQYWAKHFFAPVSVSIEEDKKEVKLYVLNDTLCDLNLKLKYYLVDFNDGVKETKELEVVANTCSVNVADVIKVSALKSKYDLSKTALIAELYDGEELVNRKSLLFAYEKFLKLPKTGYSLTADAIGSVIEITVKADKFARLVRLHNKVTTAPFSDNWFDLIPGEEKVVTLPYYEGFRLEDIEVNSVVDVEPYGSKLYDSFIKAKFLLNPVNFVVKIGQPQSHFDYNDK